MAKSNLKVDLFIVDPQNDFMGEDNGDPYTVKLADGTSVRRRAPVKRCHLRCETIGNTDRPRPAGS